jgi:hypothetical protein
MTKPRIDEASIEELERELAQRRAQRASLDMTSMELEIEVEEKSYGRLALQARLDRLGPEDGKPKRCPRCGQSVPVKVKNRKRQLRSVSGPVRLVRNYHYCGKCRLGFYPRDDELGVPKDGELTRELERRLLDFAMNDSFEHAAERWNLLFREHPCEAKSHGKKRSLQSSSMASTGCGGAKDNVAPSRRVATWGY